MTFDTRLDGIIALLQRQGRVSYRALKRRFNLDDETLEVLKDELINAQRVAVDEDGRVLVWAGDTHTSERDEPPQSTPDPPEAERRQMTVLFCHLVDSTYLSGQMDPEDWRDIIRAYQRTCTEVIARFDGYIAQYLDDGLLVYFGYPQAHEDDAQRAVRGSLHLLEALRALRHTLPSNEENRLAVRLGIHTGLVVVNTIRDRVRHEQQALGETLHIEGYFLCQALGAHRLRGVSRVIPLYRVLEASGARSRLDVAAPRGLTPLVGRQPEVGLLLERWNHAKAGTGQAILLTGEAGIGKSRLVQVLKEQLADAPHTLLECRCSPYDQHSAFYAVLDMWERNVGVGHDDTPETKRRKLERTLSQYNLPLQETVPLFAYLLSLPLPEDQYPPLALTPQRQRQKLLFKAGRINSVNDTNWQFCAC